MRLEPLTSTLGAIAHDLDLSRPDTLPWPELRAAWLRHRVLFVRGQQLGPQAQVLFARGFGALTPAHPLVPGHPEAPEVLVLDSAAYELGVGRRGQGTSYNDRWHTDVTFTATPPAGTVLHAVQLPSLGGDTLWADLVDAYATLSAPLRQMLDGLTAVHDAHGTFGRPVNEDQGERDRRIAALPPVVHPVVRRHPETGERGLFVNPTFTRRIEQLGDEESAAVLKLLYDHLASPDRTVRWRWQPGDVAIWDNRSTAHYAVADYRERRVMHRVTLAGDRPVA